MTVPRAFLCWTAGLATTSWVGITLAELGHFSAWVALAAGVAAAVWTAYLLGRPREPGIPGGGLVVGCVVVALCSLFPTVDTTLLSQDASVHLAAGRWLDRTGSLAIGDPTLDGLSEQTRLELFEISDVGARLTQARLPGGIVLPRLTGSTSYPSLSHLLEVWIAIADRLGGATAARALAPLFAATGWWAVGLVALFEAGLAAAFTAIALLATWLPEHWFARFLMPEILTQALLWSAVAAASIADRAAFERRSSGGSGSEERVAACLTGLCLGIAGFARLEQVVIFLPALGLARALTRGERRVLPAGAGLPFVLTAGHACLHLAIVPTDYGNRIGQVLLSAAGRTFLALGGTFTNFGLALLAVAALAIVLWRRLRRDETRLLARLLAGAFALGGFIVLYHRDVPAELPAMQWLAWYVPWPVWAALVLRLGALLPQSGLGLAFTIEAIDQIMNPRVSIEQIWGSRRLVPVVLPLIALAAGRVMAAPTLRRRLRTDLVARLLLGVAFFVGLAQLRHVIWHRVQAGGQALVREIAAALPPSGYVVLAKPLDWLHLAPALWLGGGPTTILPASFDEFPAALGRVMERLPDDSLFALAGGVAPLDPAAAPPDALPLLPAGYDATPVATFHWRTRMLETTEDRPPRALVEREATVKLLRLRPPRPETPRAADPRTP
jgi:hypothetical protein